MKLEERSDETSDIDFKHRDAEVNVDEKSDYNLTVIHS